MERKDRKRDILEMALKTSGIRNQKKCRKSLLFEFDKVNFNCFIVLFVNFNGRYSLVGLNKT